MGLIARIELASFAGHPFDLSLLTYSSRLYYETGRFDTLFPALPLVYYIQIAFYSLYALIRDSGFTDLAFMYHANYIVEGIFLRIPLILSDIGIFLLILKFTGKLRYAAFYFLNPFIIYLTGAWGTYDSLMMLPLVYGFILTSKNQQRQASLMFAISGLIKLFGFVPFGLLALQNLARRRFREFGLQLAMFSGLTLISFAPFIESGLQDFYAGFVLRFIGLSGARTRAYNLVAALSGLRFTGTSPIAGIGVGAIAILFLVRSRKSELSLKTLLLSCIVAAAWLDIFSQSEPQWLSWLIPMSLLYAHLTNRVGLAGYSYFYGTVCSFLSITLLQSFGYLPFGTPVVFLSAIEAIPNTVLVYASTVTVMLLVLVGYVFYKPVKIRIDVFALVALVYLQAYFWFSIVRVIPF